MTDEKSIHVIDKYKVQLSNPNQMYHMIVLHHINFINSKELYMDGHSDPI